MQGLPDKAGFIHLYKSPSFRTAFAGASETFDKCYRARNRQHCTENLSCKILRYESGDGASEKRTDDSGYRENRRCPIIYFTFFQMNKEGGSGGENEEKEIRRLRVQLSIISEYCEIYDQQTASAHSHSGESAYGDAGCQIEKQHVFSPFCFMYPERDGAERLLQHHVDSGEDSYKREENFKRRGFYFFAQKRAAKPADNGGDNEFSAACEIGVSVKAVGENRHD